MAFEILFTLYHFEDFDIVILSLLHCDAVVVFIRKEFEKMNGIFQAIASEPKVARGHSKNVSS